MTSADGLASIVGTPTTRCDGGDPAVWFTQSQLFASSPTGESVSRVQAKDGGANTLHGRLSSHSHGICRGSVVDCAADDVKDGNNSIMSSELAAWQFRLAGFAPEWDLLEGGGW